jgi:lysophospholipase L1-like esterase
VSRTKFLAFGDSITAGTTSPVFTVWQLANAGLPQSYPFKLQSLLRGRYRDQAIDVTNGGKPGEAVADAKARFSTLLRDAAPDVVILMHGVNDVTFQRVSEVSRTAEFVNQIAREARFAKADVIICTMLPQRAGGSHTADPTVLAAYNVALRQVARGEGAKLIDFDALGFDLRLIGVDGLHPTEQGYTRLAEIFFDFARQWYEQGL